MPKNKDSAADIHRVYKNMSLFAMRVSSRTNFGLCRPAALAAHFYAYGYLKLTRYIGYNMAMLDKKTLSALQVAGIVLQVITLILVLALFYIMNARMTAIEQKQAVLEHQLDIIRSEGGYP